MEKKYLIANIQIPMEIYQDGKYETLSDFITVDFIPCDKLPNNPTNINQSINDKYKDILKGLFSPVPLPDYQEPKPNYQEPKPNQEPRPDQESKHDQEAKTNQEIKITILPCEIQQKKRGHNISFKNNRNNHNYSMKKY